MAAGVIASAGSDDKLAYLRSELKVDYAFNYRDGDPRDHLRNAAPEGLNVYFDNTQGAQLEAALYELVAYGRVAMCGGIAGYNLPVPGPRNLIQIVRNRLRLEGYIVSDHFKALPGLFAEARTRSRVRQIGEPRNHFRRASIQPPRRSSTFSIPAQETSAKWS